MNSLRDLDAKHATSYVKCMGRHGGNMSFGSRPSNYDSYPGFHWNSRWNFDRKRFMPRYFVDNDLKI